MKRIYIALFALLLSACADIGAPPTLEPAATAPTLNSFRSVSGVYRWDTAAFRNAVRYGKIGGTADKAVVPLFFGADGKLRTQRQLTGLRNFKKNATTTAKAVSYLRSIGVAHVYFTDYATYKRVMLRHSASLSSYSLLTTASVEKMSVLGRTTRYYNPYARRSASATAAVGAYGDCNPASGVLPVGTFLPQQDGECVALCVAQEVVMFSGCAFIPFPFNVICAIAAGTVSTICVDNCF